MAKPKGTTAQRIAEIEEAEQLNLISMMSNYKPRKQDHIDRVNCNRKGYYILPFIPTYEKEDGSITWQKSRPAKLMLQLVSPTSPARVSSEPPFEQKLLTYKVMELYRRIWPTIVNL
jgi:hypothetical protein